MSEMRTRFILLVGSASIVAGCTVGPDYTPPKPQPHETFVGLAEVNQPLASTPRAQPVDMASWWSVFGDDELTTLISRATTGNLTLAQANARVREARASKAIAASGLYPTVNVQGSASRSRNAVHGPNGTTGVTSNAFQAGFDASWEFDVFGGIRRGIEAADANLEASIESDRDAMVTLAGDVATTYLDLRGAQQQLAIARRNLETQTQTLSLTQERFDAGFVSALDVANARAQVSSTTSRVPALESALKADAFAMGVLLGLDPAAVMQELEATKPIPAAPTEVPVGLPSELLERRPDVRRADAQLHAATALIGVAMADQYPKFSITGALGLQGGKASSLTNMANRYWSVSPGVDWNLFDGGRTRANIALQQASADEFFAAYKQTVLVALQDVETTLVAFVKEQERRVALTQAVEANREAVDLSMLLYSNGKTDFLNVLSAQGRLLDAEDSLSQSELNVAVNLVALYKALGGGWEGMEQIQNKSVPDAKVQ